MLNIFFKSDLWEKLPMMADNILLKFIFLNVSSFNDSVSLRIQMPRTCMNPSSTNPLIMILSQSTK